MSGAFSPFGSKKVNSSLAHLDAYLRRCAPPFVLEFLHKSRRARIACGLVQLGSLVQQAIADGRCL